ncbi:MAG: hypothetical protein WCL47_05330 [Holophagaceae bacterium]
MGTRSLNKDETQAIRMAFQRLCENDESVQVLYGTFRGDFKVLADAPDRVILAMSSLERGQWGLKPGTRLTLHLLDRGLPYEAVVDFGGHGSYRGTEAAHVTLPRLLRALDTHRLAEYVPDRPIPCPFADQQNNIKDGFATAFGEDGLELAPPESTRFLGDVLRLNATSSVDLRAAVGETLPLPVRVAYFGERTWGLRITDRADRVQVGRYHRWLLEAAHAQAQRDQSRFSPGGLESRRLLASPGGAGAAKTLPVAQPRILVDRDPLILVLAEGEAFPARLAEAVGRKYGVVALDAVKGPLRPLLAPLGVDGAGWGRLRLVVIHPPLRSGSPLDRCRQLVRDEGCPLPVLMATAGEGLERRRGHALAVGAAGHLVVDPFQVLSVLRTLDQSLHPPA